MTRADPDENTDREGLAHQERSWPKASSSKDKRNMRRHEKHEMTREAREDKSRRRQEHRQRGHCPLKQELAEGQLFKRQEKHEMTREAKGDKRSMRRQRNRVWEAPENVLSCKETC